MNNFNEFIEKIKNISVLSENDNKNAYKLGVIHGMCEHYLVNDIKEEVKCNEIEIPVEENEKISFEEYCQQEITKENNIDKWIPSVLERRGNHMNLNFEVSARWNNPANKKMIIRLLNTKGICNMHDFMTIFDNPINLNTLRYTQSANKDDQKKLNKIFPLFELSDSDKKQLASLYFTANDYPENGEFKGMSSELYFQKFLTPDDVTSPYSKRYLNAFIRNGIINVNQLYFFLKNHDVKELKKMRGIGHISENVETMCLKIKEDK
jgi:hypothetical protein